MNAIPQEIVARAAQGDTRAFEIIYKELAGFVYNVAFRVVNNRPDAQEVAQEVFLTIYHKLKDFRGESSLKTWAYRITANCAINFAKKAARTRNKTMEYDDQIMSGKVENLVQEEIDREESKKSVDELLSLLNPDQRACMVLRNIEGLSYQEIAQALQVNINTVRTRLKRAREKLLAIGKKVTYENV